MLKALGAWLASLKVVLSEFDCLTLFLAWRFFLEFYPGCWFICLWNVSAWIMSSAYTTHLKSVGIEVDREAHEYLCFCLVSLGPWLVRSLPFAFFCVVFGLASLVACFSVSFLFLGDLFCFAEAVGNVVLSCARPIVCAFRFFPVRAFSSFWLPLAVLGTLVLAGNFQTVVAHSDAFVFYGYSNSLAEAC